MICHRLCRHKPGYVVAKVQDGDIDLTKLAENSNYHTTGATLHPKLEILEYPRNDIIYIRDIGQGAFGRVFQVGEKLWIVCRSNAKIPEEFCICIAKFPIKVSLSCIRLQLTRHFQFVAEAQPGQVELLTQNGAKQKIGTSFLLRCSRLRFG